MYKMCPSNEVKKASFGGNLSYWVYLFVQIAIIVLLCNRFVSNLSTRWSVPTLFSPLPSILFSPIKAAISRLSKKVKIRRRRRTCADDGDTTREILRQIVCEEHSDECAICRKILSKGIPKGEIAAVGAGVHGCCPRCSVSNFSTRCCDSKGIYKIVKDMLSRRKLLYLICA